MDTSEAPLCAFFFWSPIPNYLLFAALKGLYRLLLPGMESVWKLHKAAASAPGVNAQLFLHHLSNGLCMFSFLLFPCDT